MLPLCFLTSLLGTYRGIAFNMNMILFNESASTEKNLLMAKLHSLNGSWIQPFQLHRTWLRGQIGPFFIFLIYIFFIIVLIELCKFYATFDLFFIYYFEVITFAFTKLLSIKKYINSRLKNYYFLLSAEKAYRHTV